MPLALVLWGAVMLGIAITMHLIFRERVQRLTGKSSLCQKNMRTLLMVAFVATTSLAAGKMPGFQRPDPPEKAFIVAIGVENRITIGGASLTDAQVEAVLKVFVAATHSPAIVIQIEDIDAPGARRNHIPLIDD